MEILKAVILLGAMGLIFGAVLAFAAQKFAVEVDERETKILDGPTDIVLTSEEFNNLTDEEVKKNALIALYNMSDRSILDEVIKSPKYSDSLKMEAVEILDEYEPEKENN